MLLIRNGVAHERYRVSLITPWLPHTVTHVSAMEQEAQSGRNRFGETSPCSIFTFTHCNFLLFSLDPLLQNPRVALEELKLDRSYLIHFPPWYSKSGHFPIEVPIKNEKWPLNLSYGSIILQIGLGDYFTITHAVLRESTDFLKTTFSGTPQWS